LTARTWPINEPVEQHADCRKVLLDGRLGGCGLQRFDIGGDMHGIDVGELADAVLLNPAKK
jgi:hypothetical protein